MVSSGTRNHNMYRSVGYVCKVQIFANEALTCKIFCWEGEILIFSSEYSYAQEFSWLSIQQNFVRALQI